MSVICHACTNDVQEERITCRGFCSAVFHLKCCHLPSEMLDEIDRNRQLFWMCKSCAAIMSDVRHKKNVKAAYDAGLEKQLSGHTELLGKLKLEILEELKIEIRSNFTKLTNTTSTTPVSSRRSGNRSRTIGSRRLFEKKDNNLPPLMTATGDSPSPSLGRLTVPVSKDKFWLYLSRISRDVSAEQITELAKHRLSTEDVEVIRLVAKSKDIQTMSFVSFKVGVSTNLKAKALSSSTWPKGMLFREFVDNRKAENFWKPPGLPINTPQTTPKSSESPHQMPMTE